MQGNTTTNAAASPLAVLAGDDAALSADLSHLADGINAAHDAAVGAASSAIEYARRCGELLRDAKARLPHGEFGAWLSRNCRVGERQARTYITIAENWDRIAKRQRASELSVRAALRIAQAPPDDDKPHVSSHTGNEEWYTPPEIIEAVVRVLGGIDLDPASCEAANEAIDATEFYTRDDDGLTKPWRGRVFLNPPYTSGLVDRFAGKLAEHVEAGDVTAAILLVNNATDAKWFQHAAKACVAICFPDGRLRFIGAAGKSGPPLQGQAILYFGRDRKRFVEVFGDVGIVNIATRPAAKGNGKATDPPRLIWAIHSLSAAVARVAERWPVAHREVIWLHLRELAERYENEGATP